MTTTELVAPELVEPSRRPCSVRCAGALCLPADGKPHHALVAPSFYRSGLNQAWRNNDPEPIDVCLQCARYELQRREGVARFVFCIGRGCQWCGDAEKRGELTAGDTPDELAP